MLADLLLLLIIGYILYKFVYGFLLPVMRASRQVREQFRNMPGASNEFGDYGRANFGGQQQGGGQQRPASDNRTSTGNRTAGGYQSGGDNRTSGGQRRASKPPADDYIDFEEIK